MKKLITLVLALLCVIVLGSCYNSQGTANDESTATVDETETAVSVDEFIIKLNEVLVGCLGEDESLSNVVLNGSDLIVTVDLSNANPLPVSFTYLAWSRAIVMTDAILFYSEYDGLWETITIDFGEIGKVTCRKSDIETNEHGRHIPSEFVKGQLGIDEF